ncbi:MAG: DUF4282 domain-containing protein [Halothiobacillaceae bacterium]
MQTLLDFLSFKTFISPSVLLFCYYLGALGVPLFASVMLIWVRQQARKHGISFVADSRWKRWATQSNKTVLLALFGLFFVCMEIGWRMMFEFMLAYFQMRDALLGLG